MHYYSHNIADFNDATMHLSRLERSIYRDAIDLYYKTEQPLNTCSNRLARLLRTHTEEEKEALQYVLGEFFVKTDEGYENQRCEEEILAYHENSGRRAMAGKVSGLTRKIKGLIAKAKRKLSNTADEQTRIDVVTKLLTEYEQVLNTCSSDVRGMFEQSANRIELTKELNNLRTKELSIKGSDEPQPKQVWHSGQREQISDAYNLATESMSQGKFSKWSDKRIEKLKTRCKEDSTRTLQWWIDVVSDIPNHRGVIDQSWFSLDFLLESEDRLLKFVEGKYKKSFGGKNGGSNKQFNKPDGHSGFKEIDYNQGTEGFAKDLPANF